MTHEPEQTLEERVTELETKMNQVATNQKIIVSVLQETREVAQETLEFLKTFHPTPKANDNDQN